MSSNEDDGGGGHRALRARLRDSEVDAFAVLFRLHSAPVHRLAASLVNDTSLAEDVVGEVFLTAWRQRASIDDSDEAVEPWLLAIAARQSLNVIRGRRRAHAFLTRQAERPAELSPDIAETVAARIDDAADLARTRDAIAHLRERDLEVLVLCVWSGLSISDVAQVLGVGESAVRSRLSRARARLRVLVAARADLSRDGAIDAHRNPPDHPHASSKHTHPQTSPAHQEPLCRPARPTPPPTASSTSWSPS